MNTQLRSNLLTSVLAVSSFFVSSIASAKDAAALPMPSSLGKVLSFKARYSTGKFDQGASEIAAYDAQSNQLFVVNAADGAIDVLALAADFKLSRVKQLSYANLGGKANSVASNNGLLAVAVENKSAQKNGWIVILNAATGAVLAKLEAGAMPDMVTFSPDGNYVLSANEGEPNKSYSVDPEGSVSVVDISDRANPQNWHSRLASFSPWNGKEDALRADAIRIFGPKATAAQDFEPEYIAVSADSSFAMVTLQENNALAKVDLKTATVEWVKALGYKDHSKPGNGLDASDRNYTPSISNWPVWGMYQPDSIAVFQTQMDESGQFTGPNFFITANEGDSRDYPGYSEELRVNDAYLDSTIFANSTELLNERAIGRLKISKVGADTDGDGDFDKIYSYGTRSFSIWDENGVQVFDSGDQIEQITAQLLGKSFNSAHDEGDSGDSRSDNKGPEPEGVVVGQFGARTLAFIGLERVGGVMVYDVSNPVAPLFLDYANARDFGPANVQRKLDKVGDLGPEGLLLIKAADNPTGSHLLIVCNEVSGTTSVFEINP